MLTVPSRMRLNPAPRWSVVSPAGIRALLPPSISGPAPGTIVWVGPPLFWRGPRFRDASEDVTLFPLDPDRVLPAVLSMALKLTLTVPVLEMFGAVALVLPAITEFWTVITPAPPPARAMPPPVALAVLAVIVLFWTSSVP